YGYCFFFSSRRRHTRFSRDWSSDVCSSDLLVLSRLPRGGAIGVQAENHFSADGIAVGNATLFDEDGPFGAGVTTAVANPAAQVRSEERRVGEGGRSRWRPDA